MIKFLYELITGKPYLDWKRLNKNNVDMSKYTNLKLEDDFKGHSMLSYNCSKCGKYHKISIENFYKNKTYSCEGCRHYIYFLLERNTNKIKIGQTQDLISRLTGKYTNKSKKQFNGLESEFDIDKNNSFYIYADILSKNFLEQKYHDDFKEYRLESYGNISGKTEWFDNGEEIINKLKYSLKNRLYPLREIYKEKGKN